MFQVAHRILWSQFDVALRQMAALQTRSFRTLLRDKAYVNGQWVGAASGATFEGISIFLSWLIKSSFTDQYHCVASPNSSSE